MKTPTTVIDAGHGGHDSGALGPGGSKEKDIALNVSKRVHAILIEAGVRSILTRDSDVFLGLTERAEIANRAVADLFVSIHCNAGGGTGFEVYTSRGETTSDRAATLVFEEFGSANPGSIRRVDLTDGDVDKEAGYAVLVRTSGPAILFELEFIDTDAGESLLNDAAFQERSATAIAAGVLRFLGVELPVSPLPVIPRRNDMLRWTPAEKAIHAALDAVEEVGADPLLTEAVTLLSNAQNKVADYVDADLLSQ
ncbi:N-acetylmuramoyl-L-alanine amidase [Haloferula luteola]|uniref:N-acetylmuramoyl-L-alanine amidase n=1 Tax=Haloferula luteola TaxID=595692 RepID=A0A840VBP9_9BACT|nr:N-acetylmuramoyl-L-alanine amidase [Haloferula luteola]MBB5351360.1 N-acetylmuramoyl-L-alanine amidase [Haloferula luteola]